jgi:hypothetical protein
MADEGHHRFTVTSGASRGGAIDSGRAARSGHAAGTGGSGHAAGTGGSGASTIRGSARAAHGAYRSGGRSASTVCVSACIAPFAGAAAEKKARHAEWEGCRDIVRVLEADQDAVRFAT